MENIDDLLMLLENPTRREILRRLTMETHYPLQLAKELKLSPQAVMKHLDLLERHGMVRCSRTQSRTGPTRKCYVATKSLSLRLEVTPHLLEVRIDELPGAERTEDKVNVAQESFDIFGSFASIRDRLREINNEISALETRLLELLWSRDRQLSRASRMILELSDSYEERGIMHYLLTHDDPEISDISRSLGLREEVLRDALLRLQRKRLI